MAKGNGSQGAQQRALALAIVVRQSRQSGHDRALSRALPQLRPDPRRAHLRQADHRHRADRLRLEPVQPPSPRARQSRARGHPRRRRHRLRISGPSHPGDRQAADRGARPQPRLSRPGRGALRLSARRRGADHRLRQDHARLPDGGGDGQHAGDRALRRADARQATRTASCAGSGTVDLARAPGPSPPARSTTRNSSTSSPPRRRRSAIATPWAPPRP